MEESTTRVKIPQAILDDLCSRFLINIPEEERTDMVRICFQIELAHWFYIDFCRQEDLDLPPCGMLEFMKIIFHKFPFLKNTEDSVEMIYENWKRYKIRVPVFGAILLDESLTKCLLVQGFHNRASWGFPKGKVNKDEDGFDCAKREVREETGFDITNYADPQDSIEHNLLDHQVRLYVVPGVPYDTNFQPITRGEIKEIKWFAVDDLPAHKKDMTPKERLGINPNSFFQVQPFIRHLRKWLNRRAGLASSESEEKQELNLTPLPSLPQPMKEYDVRRQKEEMQKRFQEMHRLSHPLRMQTQGSERRLLSLLGISPLGSQPEMHTPDSPVGSPRKPPESQPEAIRKLLTGTVTSSPLTTPEKPPVRTRESPSARRSLPHLGEIYHKSIEASEDTMEGSGTTSGRFSMMQGTRSSTEVCRNTKRKEYQHKAKSFDLALTGYSNKGSFGGKREETECEKELHSEEYDFVSLRDFSFRAPAWTNFSFSKKQLLATLPS